MTVAVALQHAAEAVGISLELLRAVCSVESNLNPSAHHKLDGYSDSYGLCQIKHETALGLGFKGSPKKLFDPKINAYYAAKYLDYQLGRYDGDWLKAISAYNAGSYRMSNMKYVRKVLKKLGEQL